MAMPWFIRPIGVLLCDVPLAKARGKKEARLDNTSVLQELRESKG